MEAAVDSHKHDTLNSPNPSWSARRHLTDTKDLTTGEISYLVDLAKGYKRLRLAREAPQAVNAGRILANLFYENSTRTRMSFELAARALGMNVLNLDTASSSIRKGETLEDTARALLAMGAGVIVQRHSASGSADRLVQLFGDRLHVVNAGDGINAHPTQGLLDLMTMLEVRPSLAGARVAIVGDITYSRVARSDIWLLKKMGADIHVAGPPSLVPLNMESFGVTVHKKLEDTLQFADFVIALRLQIERQEAGLISNLEEYSRAYRLDHTRLKLANPNVRLLHPGPVNRGVEITDDLADDTSISLIDQQVTNGVAMRMAVLDALCSTDR
jgi:aspartate carbamoyltransferase catalytic subunit